MRGASMAFCCQTILFDKMHWCYLLFRCTRTFKAASFSEDILGSYLLLRHAESAGISNGEGNVYKAGSVVNIVLIVHFNTAATFFFLTVSVHFLNHPIFDQGNGKGRGNRGKGF